MKLNFVKLSPSSNMTILISDYVPEAQHSAVARKIMDYDHLHAEQLGFIEKPRLGQNALIRLQMSGGEFCGNACLSAISYAIYKGLTNEKQFYIESSGAQEPLLCQWQRISTNTFITRSQMPKENGVQDFSCMINGKAVNGSLVSLEGISHFITQFWPAEPAEFDFIMSALIDNFDLDCMGIIPYKKLNSGNYKIKPFVYVRPIATRIFEKACGSGSLSLGVHLNRTLGESSFQVEQPGGVISVEIGDKNFIETRVSITGEGLVYIEELE